MRLAVILFCLLLALALEARAATEVTLRWVAPTQCTNGDELGATALCPALTRYALSCGSEPGGPYEWLWGTDASNTSDTREYADGEFYCVLRARNSAEANSGFSDYSNEIHFSTTTPPPSESTPNPPTSITIEVAASQ
jgi:hypothetical protein